MHDYQLRPERDVVALGLRLAAQALYERHKGEVESGVATPMRMRRLADRMEDCLLSANELVGYAKHDTNIRKSIEQLRTRAAAIQYGRPS